MSAVGQKLSSTRIVAVLVSLALAGTLTACVTNEETGHPEQWQEITPKKVESVAALVPENIAARGTISVGTNPPFAPFEFKDSSGEIIGFEIDIARAVASIMGLDLEVREQDFAMILPAVTAGTVDMGASGFTDTPERRENFDFINTLYAGVQWVQRTDREPGDDIDPDHPCGLKVAVQRATVPETDDLRPKNQACLDAGLDPIEILAYDTSDTAATAMVVGTADAWTADSPIAAWAIERADGQIETTGEQFQAAPYGMTTPKDSPLSKAVSQAMASLIASGDYRRIMEMWGLTDGLLDQALINEHPVKESL